MKASAMSVLMICATVMGCSQQKEQAGPEVVAQPAKTWTTIAVDSMTETQIAQRELCLAATKTLAKELMGELMTALDSGDPTVAVDVCQAKAPAIASHVSDMLGVTIGRTSHKLRNSANTPPQWAEQLVDTLVDQPTFLSGPEDQLGALLPIKLKAECEMCHGAVETIDEGLLATLNAAYPDDQATGFAAGDLRGWFWVEAPAGATASDDA